MVSKCISGSSFAGAVDYLKGVKGDEKKAEVLMAHGVRPDLETCHIDFGIQASMRPSLKKNVQHVVLAHHPDDASKIKREETKILADWMRKMRDKKGLDLANTQFIVIKHNDKKHPHYHLLFNRVDNDGNTVKDNFIGIKCKEISKEITQKYELTRACQPELRKEKQREQIQEIERGQQTAKRQSTSFGLGL